MRSTLVNKASGELEMVGTFRLMSQIRQQKFMGQSNEKLVEEFKKTNNQSILAELFCRNFTLISKVFYEPVYSYIDKDDKISSVLSCIYNSATNFDINKGYAFNTFMIKCIRSGFNLHIQHLSYRNRNANNLYSLERMCEDFENQNIETNFIKPYDESYDKIELISNIDRSNLSESEKIMCKAIIEDSSITNNELAELLECHRHTVRNMKNNLKTKLSAIVY
jgi:DNA-directed RNA polymerase specialized sigma subunit